MPGTTDERASDVGPTDPAPRPGARHGAARGSTRGTAGGARGRAFTLGPDPDPRLTVGEVLALGAVVVVGALTWAGAFLAHADRWTLAGVVVLAGALVVAVGSAVVRRPPRVRVDRTELAVLAAVTALAAIMFLPGFPYAYGDKDPGIYVAQGFTVEREGTTRPFDPVAAVRPPVDEFDPEGPTHLWGPGARFPGVWVDDQDHRRVNSQFYDAVAALFGTAIGLAGSRAVFQLTPLLAIVSVATLTVAARRVFGPLVAALAGVLLATNMLQVWQAKYPSTEILAQLLVHAALLAGILAVTTRWTPAAGLAGAATSLAFIARPDGVLLAMLGVAVVAAAVAFGRADRRVGWFAVGLAIPLPHAMWQAYRINERYSAANDVPGLRTVVAVAAVLLLAGAALRYAAERGPRWRAAAQARIDAVGRDRLVAGAAIAVVVAAGIGMVLGFLRPRLFGETTAPADDGGTRRLFNEHNLRRLSWFLTVPGIVGAWYGLAVTALRRRTLAAVVLLGPGLLLLPLYVHRSRASPRLMWWGRRYIPLVLAVLVVLLAVAIVWTWTRRGRFRLPVAAAGAALAALVVVNALAQSLPLRDHGEFEGSYEIAAEIAAATSDDGFVLWVRPTDGPLDPLRNLPTPVWLIHGRPGAFLPREPRPDDLDGWRADLPGRELFVVASTGHLPRELAGAALERVHALDASLPLWDEQTERRPDRAITVPVRLTVWRVTDPS